MALQGLMLSQYNMHIWYWADFENCIKNRSQLLLLALGKKSWLLKSLLNKLDSLVSIACVGKQNMEKGDSYL